MSDESEVTEQGNRGATQVPARFPVSETTPLRRDELLARVREVNRRSLSGPDSPSIQVYRRDTC